MSNEPDDKKAADDEPMYYIENGLMVFTRAFHLKRGSCCKSGCRHCPYGFQKNEGGPAGEEDQGKK